MQALVRGFKGSALFPIVAVLAFTGARRSEVLALRCKDIDVSEKDARSSARLSRPKDICCGSRVRKRKSTSARSRLMMTCSPSSLPSVTDICGLSPAFPTAPPVDLSLVKLPADALMFPNPPESGEGFSFTRLRNPRNTAKEFVRKAAALGFPDLQLKDLRGTHETHLLTGGCRRPPSPRAAVMIRP